MLRRELEHLWMSVHVVGLTCKSHRNDLCCSQSSYENANISAGIEAKEVTARTRLSGVPVRGDADVTRAIECEDDERNVINEIHG